MLNMEIKGVKGCVDSRGGVLVDRRFFRLAAGGWLAVGDGMKVNLEVCMKFLLLDFYFDVICFDLVVCLFVVVVFIKVLRTARLF